MTTSAILVIIMTTCCIALGDGAKCGHKSSFNSPPWFHRELRPNVEIRVCRNELDSQDEYIAIEMVEIYVQL
jgi:hypothetical protein